MSTHEHTTSVRAAHANPTEEEWNRYKAFIRQTYVVQDKPLKDVMAIMSTEYDFHATAKMYKSRLAKWHFVKNNNLKDMKTVARLITQTNVSNAKELHKVNGRYVTAEAVARYFRRKGIKRLEEAVGDIPKSSSRSTEESSNASCDANQIDHVQRNPEQQRSPQSVGDQEATAWVMTNMLSRDLLPSPSIPASFNSPNEVVLKMIAVYYTGCCESNLWYTCSAGRFRTRRFVYDSASVLDSFVGFWTIGLDSAKKGNMLDFNHALSQAYDKLPRIIQAEHPSTIRALLEMVLEYAKAGLCRFAVSFLKEIARISPREHPLAVICRQILQVEPSEAESMALAALTCAADTLANQCGEYHYCVLRCRTALIKSNSTYLNHVEVIDLANRFLADLALSSQSSVEGYLNVCESLLENLHDVWPLEEAQATIERMKQYALELCPERTRKWTVNCLDLLSKVQFSQGQLELAEHNCRLYIQERTADFGVSDSRVQACTSRLINWLCVWNRFDEALDMRERGLIGLA